MRRLLLVSGLAFLAACDAGPQPAQTQHFQTVTQMANQPHAPLQPPPMLLDEAPPPKPKPLNQWDRPEPIVFTPEDEKVRGALPFSPAIAMDPIDGSKISVRATTPTLQYKGKIYYFSSEANKSSFKATPEVYLKGGMMRL